MARRCSVTAQDHPSGALRREKFWHPNYLANRYLPHLIPVGALQVEVRGARALAPETLE
jgi:hypothetical protein